VAFFVVIYEKGDRLRTFICW